MPKLKPFLWFDNQAEEAANFYVATFPNSKILQAARYGDAGPGPKGSVMTIEFALDGKEFVALNGGPQFKFTEAVSFVIDCKNQEEVDRYWEQLSQGGQPGPCGWVKDKFGLSWQVVPTVMAELLSGTDPTRSKRAMEAMFKMTKLDIATLQQAYNGAA